jgi:hypothetical protein
MMREYLTDALGVIMLFGMLYGMLWLGVILAP